MATCHSGRMTETPAKTAGRHPDALRLRGRFFQAPMENVTLSLESGRRKIGQRPGGEKGLVTQAVASPHNLGNICGL